MQNEKREQIQQLALQEISKHKRSTAALSMRVGKTYIGLQHINRYYNKHSGKIKVLVVAPKLAIFQSWRDDAEKFKLQHLLKVIKFTTYLSLHKQDLDYDLVIFDECHSLLEGHREWLTKFTGDILGLTGTPPKYQGSEKARMVNQFCPVVYRYMTTEAVDANILNDYRIIVHYVDMLKTKTLPVKTKKGVFYTSEVESYNYWTGAIADSFSQKDKMRSSIMRMKAMQTFTSKENYARNLLRVMEDKVIVFANTQEQADRLAKHSYHANNPKSEENLTLLKEGQIEQLSCVLQLSEGITVPGLKSAIILHAYGNERKFLQRFGRCLGLRPDETALIHVLCTRGTVDEQWIKAALEDLDQDKIVYKDFNED